MLFGTPAEEGEGGKIEMLRRGAFKQCHSVIMVHPGNQNVMLPTYLALQVCTIVA
jgi:metal-dependent amidase/aminoacylase/carboxypeptidase family protein